MKAAKEFKTFAEFWPFYLSQHSQVSNRMLHALGTAVALLTFFSAIYLQKYIWILAALPMGYLPAWAGHIFIEHNRPASWKHPLYSIIADFKMLGLMLLRKL